MYDIATERKQAYKDRRRQANTDVRNPALRSLVFNRDGNACVECGARGNLMLHHKVSVYQGGTTTPDNLETLCRSCCFSKPS